MPTISASGYRKRLLDVVTAECSSAILEAAEIKRQQIGLKTVGRGPSVIDRAAQQQGNLIQDQQASADAIHYITANAERVVPENIHTPPMEGFLVCTPHPLGISVPRGSLVTPPPPRNFHVTQTWFLL